MIVNIILLLIYVLFAITVLMTMGSLLTWVERKIAALVSDRIGANRAYIIIPFTNIKIVAMGLVHIITDALKMMSKERFTPRANDKLLYSLAPWFVFVPVLLTFAFIPFGGMITIAGQQYLMQIAPIDGGVLAVLAILSLGVIGIVLAGQSSDNKYSLLGGIRAASQMISYEVTLALSLLPMVLIYGSLNLHEMVVYQSGTFLNFIPAWGIFLCPPAAIFFITSAIAENRRVPFDLPEAESELVAGYFVEYSGMKMGLFMLAEFVEIVVISCLFTTFFLGGYNLPYVGEEGIALALPQWIKIMMWPGIFFVKVFFVCCFQILIRWTLPRFRYDQLLVFGWKMHMPAGIVNLIVVVVFLWFKENYWK